MARSLFLALSLLAACSRTLPPSAAPRPDDIGTIELTTLEGKRIRLDRVVRGRVAVLSLWATWCDACKQELPALTRLAAELRAPSALVLAVAVGEPHDTVARFVAQHDLRFAQLCDERFELADALGQQRVPTTLILGADGRVLHTGGALDKRALVTLERALADQGETLAASRAVR